MAVYLCKLKVFYDIAWGSELKDRIRGTEMRGCCRRPAANIGQFLALCCDTSEMIFEVERNTLPNLDVCHRILHFVAATDY